MFFPMTNFIKASLTIPQTRAQVKEKQFGGPEMPQTREIRLIGWSCGGSGCSGASGPPSGAAPRSAATAALHTPRTECLRLAYAAPVHDRLRRAPAERSDGRRGERNAFKRANPAGRGGSACNQTASHT